MSLQKSKRRQQQRCKPLWLTQCLSISHNPSDNIWQPNSYTATRSGKQSIIILKWLSIQRLLEQTVPGMTIIQPTNYRWISWCYWKVIESPKRKPGQFAKWRVFGDICRTFCHRAAIANKVIWLRWPRYQQWRSKRYGLYWINRVSRKRRLG